MLNEFELTFDLLKDCCDAQNYDLWTNQKPEIHMHVICNISRGSSFNIDNSSISKM